RRVLYRSVGHLELDLRSGQQSKPFADLHWNGHLSLGSDPHDATSAAVLLLSVRVILGPAARKPPTCPADRRARRHLHGNLATGSGHDDGWMGAAAGRSRRVGRRHEARCRRATGAGPAAARGVVVTGTDTAPREEPPQERRQPAVRARAGAARLRSANTMRLPSSRTSTAPYLSGRPMAGAFTSHRKWSKARVAAR